MTYFTILRKERCDGGTTRQDKDQNLPGLALYLKLKSGYVAAPTHTQCPESRALVLCTVLGALS